MDADEVRRVLRTLGERGDRQRRGVGAEDRALSPITACSLGDGLGLDLAVLEHRLDHEIAVLQRGVVGRRRDAREQRVPLGRVRAALA